MITGFQLLLVERAHSKNTPTRACGLGYQHPFFKPLKVLYVTIEWITVHFLTFVFVMALFKCG